MPKLPARFILLVVSCLCLAGCGSLKDIRESFKGTFANEVTLSIDCTKSYMASLYGWFGLTAELSEGSTRRLREAFCNDKSAAPAAAPSASAAK